MPRDRGQIVDRPPRLSTIPVDQADRLPAVVNDVPGSGIALCDDLVRLRRDFVLTPDRLFRAESPRRTMERGVQVADLREAAIRSRRLWPGADSHKVRLGLVGTDRVAPGLSLDVGEYLAVLLIEAQHLGRRSEASLVNVPQVCVDGRCPESCRSMHGVADPHHAGGASAAAEPLFRHELMMTQVGSATRPGLEGPCPRPELRAQGNAFAESIGLTHCADAQTATTAASGTPISRPFSPSRLGPH